MKPCYGERFSQFEYKECFHCEAGKGCLYRNNYFPLHAGVDLSCPTTTYSKLDVLECTHVPFLHPTCRHGYQLLTWGHEEEFVTEEMNKYCKFYHSSNDTENTCNSGFYMYDGSSICMVNHPGFLNPEMSNSPTELAAKCPNGYYCPPILDLDNEQIGIVQYSCPIGSVGVQEAGKKEGIAC